MSDAKATHRRPQKPRRKLTKQRAVFLNAVDVLQKGPPIDEWDFEALGCEIADIIEGPIKEGGYYDYIEKVHSVLSAVYYLMNKGAWESVDEVHEQCAGAEPLLAAYIAGEGKVSSHLREWEEDNSGVCEIKYQWQIEGLSADIGNARKESPKMIIYGPPDSDGGYYAAEDDIRRILWDYITPYGRFPVDLSESQREDIHNRVDWLRKLTGAITEMTNHAAHQLGLDSSPS